MADPMRLAAALDSDGDGELSSREIAAAEASLKKLDRDGDGIVSRQELAESGPAQAANKEASEASQDDVNQLVQSARKGSKQRQSALAPGGTEESTKGFYQN